MKLKIYLKNQIDIKSLKIIYNIGVLNVQRCNTLFHPFEIYLKNKMQINPYETFETKYPI